MKLTVLGCSGSFAGPESPASSYLVRADDAAGRTWSIVLDLGNGALGALQRHLSPFDLDAVFISHLHPDHCADLTGLYVVRKYHPEGSPTRPLPVHGPEGTLDHMVQMYFDSDPDEMAQQFEVAVSADTAAVRVGPMTVTPYAVDHPVAAFGYRVECDGRTLAFTGDTDTCDNLGPLMAQADLVLADSAFVDGRDETRGIHLTGSRAAQAAVDAGGVGRLMLTHIPAWNDPQVCRAQAAAVWPGDVELAVAGATYVVASEADAAQ